MSASLRISASDDLKAHVRDTSLIEDAVSRCFDRLNQILRILQKLPATHTAVEQLEDSRAKLNLWTTDFGVFASGSKSMTRALRLIHGHYAYGVILEEVSDLLSGLEQCFDRLSNDKVIQTSLRKPSSAVDADENVTRRYLTVTGIYSNWRLLYQGLIDRYKTTLSHESLPGPQLDVKALSAVRVDDDDACAFSHSVALDKSLPEIERHIDRLVDTTVAVFNPRQSVDPEEFQAYEPRCGADLIKQHQDFCELVIQQTGRSPALEEYMKDRLISTIMSRWRRLMYIAENHNGLDSRLAQVLESLESPQELSTPTPWSSRGSIDVHAHASCSSTSTATSPQTATSRTSYGENDFPTPPIMRLGETMFRCQYCRREQPAINASSSYWESHLVHDLQPYVCLYDHCPTPLTTYRSSTEWEAHMLAHHAETIWRCHQCPNNADESPRTFYQSTDYRKHISKIHPIELSEQEWDLVVASGRSERLQVLKCCPMCRWVASTDPHSVDLGLQHEAQENRKNEHNPYKRTEAQDPLRVEEQRQRALHHHISTVHLIPQSLLSLPWEVDVKSETSSGASARLTIGLAAVSGHETYKDVNNDSGDPTSIDHLNARSLQLHNQTTIPKSSLILWLTELTTDEPPEGTVQNDFPSGAVTPVEYNGRPDKRHHRRVRSGKHDLGGRVSGRTLSEDSDTREEWDGFMASYRKYDRVQVLLDAARHGRHRALAQLLDEGGSVDAHDADGLTLLHLATIYGSVESVRVLLGYGADIEARNSVFGTPLCLAVMFGRTDCVAYLLSSQAQVSDPDSGGGFGSVLHAACFGANPEIVLQLMDAKPAFNNTATFRYDTPDKLQALRSRPGSAENLSNSVDISQREKDAQLFEFIECQPLYIAAYFGRKDVLRLLLVKNAYVDGTASWKYLKKLSHADVFHTGHGTTALQIAAYQGHTACVRLLLDHGADVDHRDSDDETALMSAAYQGRADCLDLLLRHPHGEDVKPQIARAVRYCIEERQPSMIRQLMQDTRSDVDSPDECGETALFYAVRQRNFDCVKVLVECGADYHIRNHEGETALNLAIQGDHVEMVRMMLTGTTISDHMIVKRREHTFRGGDLISQYSGGRTALSVAVSSGNSAIVNMLLESGADVNLRDHNGKTPMHWAASQGYAKIAKALLESVSKLSILRGKIAGTQYDSAGSTALHVAASRGHLDLVDMLLRHGATTASKIADSKASLSSTPLSSRTELSIKLAKESLDLKDGDGRTLLMYLALRGEVGMARRILDSEADVNLADKAGKTALMLATEMDNSACVRLLLERGAKVDAADHPDGNSALLLAVEHGSARCVQALLDHGASIDFCNAAHKTALVAAVEAMDGSCIKILLDKKASIEPLKQHFDLSELQTALKDGLAQSQLTGDRATLSSGRPRLHVHTGQQEIHVPIAKGDQRTAGDTTRSHDDGLRMLWRLLSGVTDSEIISSNDESKTSIKSPMTPALSQADMAFATVLAGVRWKRAIGKARREVDL